MRIVIGFVIAASCLFAADVVPLWPRGAPGEKGPVGEERDTTDAKGRPVAGKRVARIGFVSKPTLTVSRPKNVSVVTPAVLVFPGGGYNILAYDLEGSEVAEWLNSIGVTAVLVKYRVPRRAGDEKHELPLADAQRALGWVRSHAEQLKVDPKKIGVIGFSAGGHLSANISNNFDKRVYDAVDEADRVSCRPDFAMLIYPAYLSSVQGEISSELSITANTPPTFLVQAEDDNVKIENSLFYYLALKKARVPAEMHLFAKGGHGYGLRPTELPITGWPALAEKWLRTSGVFK